MHLKIKAGAGTGNFGSADFLRFSYSLDGGQSWTVFANYFGNDNGGLAVLALDDSYFTGPKLVALGTRQHSAAGLAMSSLKH